MREQQKMSVIVRLSVASSIVQQLLSNAASHTETPNATRSSFYQYRIQNNNNNES